MSWEGDNRNYKHDHDRKIHKYKYLNKIIEMFVNRYAYFLCNSKQHWALGLADITIYINSLSDKV